jgi:hypothetical protein
MCHSGKSKPEQKKDELAHGNQFTGPENRACDSAGYYGTLPRKGEATMGTFIVMFAAVGGKVCDYNAGVF